jgi:hypothetical protein
VVRAIGVVPLVYVNPETEDSWVIDYRIFDPDTDGPNHARSRPGDVAIDHRRVPFPRDGVGGQLVRHEGPRAADIDGMAKTFCCPLESNRQVDDPGGERPYRRADGLDRGGEEPKKGKPIPEIEGFPEDPSGKPFRVVVAHPRRPERIVTNDLLSSRDSAHEARGVRGARWEIEEFHREARRSTGIEGCRCRAGASSATT